MLNENVKKLLKENMWDLATCSAGVPNAVPVAFKDVTDDGKLVVGDVFLDTTLRNLAANRHLRLRRQDARRLSDPRHGRARCGRAGRGHVQGHGRADVPGCGYGEGRAHHHTGDRRCHDAGRGEQKGLVTAIFHRFLILLFLPGAGRGTRDAVRVSRPFLHTCIRGETAVCCRQQTAERSHFYAHCSSL